MLALVFYSFLHVQLYDKVIEETTVYIVASLITLLVSIHLLSGLTTYSELKHQMYSHLAKSPQIAIVLAALCLVCGKGNKLMLQYGTSNNQMLSLSFAK